MPELIVCLSSYRKIWIHRWFWDIPLSEDFGIGVYTKSPSETTGTCRINQRLCSAVYSCRCNMDQHVQRSSWSVKSCHDKANRFTMNVSKKRTSALGKCCQMRNILTHFILMIHYFLVGKFKILFLCYFKSVYFVTTI